MTEVNTQEYRDTDVCGQKIAGRPILWPENIEAVNESQYDKCHNRYPRSLRLHNGMVWQLVLGDTLGFAGLTEAQEDNTTTDPGYEARSVGQVYEPVEDNCSRCSTIEVCEGAEERRCSDRWVWNTTLRTRLEERWSISRQSE